MLWGRESCASKICRPLANLHPVPCVPRGPGTWLMPIWRAPRLPHSLNDPVEEGRECITVPGLERVGGDGVRSVVAKAGDGGDLVGDVGVCHPADRDESVDAPGVLLVDPD